MFSNGYGNSTSEVVDGLFSSLGLDKAVWVEDIQKEDCSLQGFPLVVGETVNKWEVRKG